MQNSTALDHHRTGQSRVALKCPDFCTHNSHSEVKSLRVLLTAFEPYDVWDQNSSWEALVAFLQHRGSTPGVTTRRYPVDLERLQQRLYKDLELGFDSVVHLGQAPGTSRIHLEAIALNVAGMTDAIGDFFGPLLPTGPVAYRTKFPLDQWNLSLRSLGIPSSVSFHAGTYLCNAVMYLTHHWHTVRQLDCSVGFMHIPLTPEQVLHARRDFASMPKEQSAEAIATILDLILEKRPQTMIA
jgi:pyroglutamyl-peptidase